MRFLFVGLDVGRGSQMKGGYMRWIAHLCFGCCCEYRE